MSSEWEQIAEQVGGRVVVPGSFWKESVVEAPVPFAAGSGDEGWVVTLDRFTTHVSTGTVTIPIQYSRASAAFYARDPLRLQISPTNLLTGLATFFGAQDVQIGHEDFDRAFQIKASQSEQALRLLNGEAGASLRAQFFMLPNLFLSVTDNGKPSGVCKRVKLPQGADQVCAFCSGGDFVTNAGALFDLVALVLRGLVRIGAAQQEAPSTD